MRCHHAVPLPLALVLIVKLSPPPHTLPVVTVRDFSLVFDALTQFEESLISAKLEQVGSEGEIAYLGGWGLIACNGPGLDA